MLRPDGADGHARLVDAVDPDVDPGVRGVNHVTAADVDADVMNGHRVGIIRRIEKQVTALQIVQGHVHAFRPLVTGVVQQEDARLRPGAHREP